MTALEKMARAIYAWERSVPSGCKIEPNFGNAPEYMEQAQAALDALTDDDLMQLYLERRPAGSLTVQEGSSGTSAKTKAALEAARTSIYNLAAVALEDRRKIAMLKDAAIVDIHPEVKAAEAALTKINEALKEMEG